MKKRSLLVATAMLLIALLVATGTTYAWFTGASEAKTNVSMAVAQGQTLEISKDGINWVSTLDLFDSKYWKDFSTNSTDVATNQYYTKVTANESTEITGYELANVETTQKIYFRSTKADAVKMTGTIAFTTAQSATYHNELIDYARVTMGGKIFADAAKTVNNTIAGTTLADNTGSYETVKIGTGDSVCTLALNSNTGYYEGEAFLTCWIEGTLADNGNVNGLTSNLDAKLTFAQ